MQNNEELAQFIASKKAEAFFGTTQLNEDLIKLQADAESKYNKKSVSLIQKAVDDGMSISIVKDKVLDVIVISIPEINFKVSMIQDNVSIAFFNAVAKTVNTKR